MPRWFREWLCLWGWHHWIEVGKRGCSFWGTIRRVRCRDCGASRDVYPWTDA